ncbi:HmuY family protein [Sphingobacterium psychroaquaticum]|uniref:HmuY protein n=1 Tax=Sphingobacterium psychroaquaticum TaxID=561061 RepID=A0A1X7HWX2_9SPHI|nr:HmuY family protein [Sphingobacterium psychroaquaticum]SMG06081.1 HmuY protein [Sphingobacterium psychroaquaticum]
MLFIIGLNKISLIAAVVLVAGCSKDDGTSPALEDGKSTIVYDLAGDTKASIAEGIDGKEKRPFYTFLYNLEQRKQIWLHTKADSTQWMKTNLWDIAFTGNYNGDIQINNSQHVGTPGQDGPVKNTAIIMLERAYDSVSEAPSDSQFDNSKISTIGWAKESQDAGWYSYNLATHVMNPYPNRTYVLRLPSGKYAKLQILSAYKGNPPAVTDLFWPAPYFTFKYFVQADGSKNLKTK